MATDFKSVFKMDRKIYIFFCAIVSAYADLCSISEEYQCRYTITCTDVVEIDMNWDSFRYVNEPSPLQESCNQYVFYNGYNLYPVTLVFKQSDMAISSLVPETIGNWNIQEILNIIHTLDLSENNYHEVPTIRSMMNLAVLNISRNEITTAVLSNNNPLSVLTTIDMSYNMITDIKVNNGESIYNTLKVIDLSHNYIVNIPDAAFDPFDNLETLDLSYNYIDILRQFTFEGIRKLIYLNLSNNRLTDINSSLFRFSELSVLNLSSNKIKNLQVNDFKQLVKLKVLDLSSNNIKTINGNVFQAMISLKSLDLRQNSLEVLDKNIFYNLQSLDRIELAKNKIRTLPTRLFRNMTILFFSINENRLEGYLDKGMFEGINVTRLDVSNQFLTEIKDYTFHNLLRLDTLILKSNRIQTLGNMCFKTLINLQVLDLSNNQLENINFDKADLGNLQSFILRNNRLTEIKHEQLKDLKSLEYLDISGNMITRLEPNSFRFLKNLINLEIHKNPLEGVLESDTFAGLVLLPNLDISHSMLTTIRNATFNDMTALQNLDMSFCKIIDLEYNVFIHTGYLEILDLSHNKLKNFFINTTELIGLSMLFLHDNLIKTIAQSTFIGLSRLNNITLSHNAIVSIDSESFSNLPDLRYLDVSYNQRCNITGFLKQKLKDLNNLVLSGIKTDISFQNISQDNQITDLTISNASIQNINGLYLHGVAHIDTLVLSFNNISKLQINDFTGLNVLRRLDLSFNKISFVQPGAFKNNTLMNYLNISHNYLQTISYGMFHGLHYLNTLDLSYNSISDLRGERFYELNFLSELIADHNKIDALDATDFLGTSLRRLSIGDNPLSCDILVKLQRNRLPFEITAIRIDEHTNENVRGIVCNKRHISSTIAPSIGNEDNGNMLNRLQKILSNLSKDNNERDDKDIQYLEKISNLLEKSNSIYDKKLTSLIEVITNVRTINNKTSMMFDKIIELLNKNRTESFVTTSSTSTQTTLYTTTIVPTLKSSNSYENKDVIAYINKIKKELENAIAKVKENIVKEFKSKVNQNNDVTQPFQATDNVHEKLVSSKIQTSPSLFTETCVAVILLILVGLVLYKFYKSRMFVRNRFSISTRELPGAIENSNL